MKVLRERIKWLQEETNKCLSNLVHARQYHDKMEEAGAVFVMERLLVLSTHRLQDCIDKLEGCGSVVDWQTGEPKENGVYLVTTMRGIVRTAYWNIDCWLINDLPFSTLKIKAWCKLSNIKPYKEKEE